MNYAESKEQQKQANQAIFIGIGADTTKQYLEVLDYCRQENLPIVNIFVAQNLNMRLKKKNISHKKENL